MKSTASLALPPPAHVSDVQTAELRNDDWLNYSTGMGVPGIDNRTAWTPYARTRDQTHMRRLWMGDGLAGRIVELPAEEMTRERGDVNLGDGTGYDEAERLLRAHLDEANVWAKFSLAKKLERAYGGGALIMSVNDGMPWDQPIDMRRLEAVRGMILATPDELTAVNYYDSPERGDLYGKPALYRWQPMSLPFRGSGGMKMVHESRVIAFTGLAVDNERLVQNMGWGDSVLARCEERIRDTASALAGVGVALQNFSQDVLQLLKLSETIGAKDGLQKVNNRVAQMRHHKSMLGALLIDTAETYTRQGIPMAGVADALTQFANFLSATTGIPVPILMGYSSVGLGDTGATQVRTFHAWIQAEQENSLRPAFNKYLRLLMRSRAGPTGGIEPPKWELVFNPLAKPTPSEEDQRRKTQADIDGIYMERQVYGPGAVAKSRFKGPTGFSAKTEVDTSAWAPLPDLEPGVLDPEPSDLDIDPANPTEGTVSPAAGMAESAADTALNGAQVTSALEIIQSVARRELPRASGVAMLMRFFSMEQSDAEQVMGSVGQDFFTAETAGPDGTATPARTDADTYAGLLAREVPHGGATSAEVQREVARLYAVTKREAGEMMRTLEAHRLDAADATNFPRQGANEPVGLRASRWPVFDPAYVQSLKADWPEIWAMGGNLTGNTQFERLLPMARAEEDADTGLEEHAVRLREAWAALHAGLHTPRTVVAMAKQLVVGAMGEAAMKRVLEAEKEKVRRKRAAGS